MCMNIKAFFTVIFTVFLMCSCVNHDNYFLFDIVNNSKDTVFCSGYGHLCGDTRSTVECLWGTSDSIAPSGSYSNSEFLGTVYSRKSIAESWNDYFAKRNCDTVYVVISKSKYSYFAGDMVSLPSGSTVLGVFKYSRENVDLNSTKQVIVYE